MHIFLKRLMEDSFMKINLLNLVLALLFVIGLLAIDSVRANKFGFAVESPLNADQRQIMIKAD